MIKLYNGKYTFQFIQEEVKLAHKFSMLWMTVQILDPYYKEREKGKEVVYKKERNKFHEDTIYSK